MTEGKKPPLPPDYEAVVKGAARAVSPHYPSAPGTGTFAEGVEAHVAHRKRMTPESEGACDLGDYLPGARLDAGGHNGDGNGAVFLDGEAPRPIKFPPWWRPWFAKQTQRTLRALDRLIDWLDEHGEEEADRRLADLNEVLDHHRARRRLIARARWAAKYAGPAAGLTWGAVTFANDKVGRVIEQLPVLRAVWKAIMGQN